MSAFIDEQRERFGVEPICSTRPAAQRPGDFVERDFSAEAPNRVKERVDPFDVIHANHAI